MAPTGRDERIMFVVLVVVSVLLVIGGAIVLAGGADADSEAGRLAQPGAAGLALLSIGVVCGSAALLVRRRHRLALPTATAATIALAALAVFRLWRYGVVGVADLVVPILLAVLILRRRPVAPST